MKKITFIVFALIAGNSFAQVDPNNGTANASAIVSADIVSVIAIEKDVDLSFGKIITGTAGNVIIDYDGNRTGNADIVTSTTTTAAKFTITAEDDYTYSISIVGTPLSNGGTLEMDVDYDLSLPLIGNTGGTDTELFIGGTLTVASAQPVGAYEGSVAVTVAYE